MRTKANLATFAGVILLSAHLLDIFLFFPPGAEAGQSLGGFATSIELLLSLVLIVTLALTTTLRWFFNKSGHSTLKGICKFLGILNIMIVAIVFAAFTYGYSRRNPGLSIPPRFHSLMSFLSF